MTEAIIGIGTNMGDKIDNINKAINAMSLVPGIEILKISNFYETKPFKVPDKQDNYINCCVRLRTENTAKVLLGICLGIEASMGRERKYRFCSRIIDIDILVYGNECINDSELIIPHPRMSERAFVLIPFDEVCDNHQFGNLDIESFIKTVDKNGVKLIKKR